MAVYLIHFSRPLNESSKSPFGQARHYAGYTKRNIDARFEDHQKGNGAAILKAVLNAGISFEIVQRWPSKGREFERWLKRGSLTPHCPLCRAEHLRLKRLRQAERRKIAKQGEVILRDSGQFIFEV